MLTALHNAEEPSHAAPVEDFSIRGRPSFCACLAEKGDADGPYAARFGDLVRTYRQPIEAALHRHDALAAGVAATKPDGWVITHGEPKPNNTMVTATGPVLVDWDTVALAPPARDLWMTKLVDDYTESTGRTVPAEEMEYYRLHWDLKDLCTYAAWFARPHRRTADTDMAWQGSVAICRRLAKQDVW